MESIPICEQQGCDDNATKYLKQLQNDGSLIDVWVCNQHYQAVFVNFQKINVARD